MTPTATTHGLCQDPAFQSLKDHLIESTGLAYYADKDADLADRILPRLALLSMRGCGSYLALLRDRDAGEAERHLLISQLTIGETYFFRFTEQFDALRDLVLPDLIARNQSSRTLRIWSAGCAIGAEPYSVAILLKRHFADRLAGWDVRILGTDINQNFLARAARGEFDERALRSTPDDIKREWFSPVGSSWTIAPSLRDWVSFQYQNLVEHPFPSIVHGTAALDLILCRNVMIYFDWKVIQRLLGQFHECLVDGGWLAVGHAESNTDLFRSYRTVNVPGATLYQKDDGRPAVAAHSISASAPPPPSSWASLAEWSPGALPSVPDAPTVCPPQPEPPKTGLPLIRQLADEGKWQQASSACVALLEEDRLNPAIHFYQGLIFEQTQQPAEAEHALRRALYLDRALVFAHYHLALLLRRRGDCDGSVQSLRNVQGLLSKMRLDEPVAHSDGLTADDLGQLTGMHLDLWIK